MGRFVEKKVRNSNVEFLRVISAMGVIVLHFNDSRAFLNVDAMSLNQFFLFLLESVFICAVDLFVIISGFFLCNSNKRSLNKIIELIFQIIIIQVFAFVIECLYFDEVFSLRRVIIAFTPANYFVILYSVTFLISPYINRLLFSLNKKELNIFMLICIFLFSLYPTFLDLIKEFLRIPSAGLSPITGFGNFQGFNIVNFILSYCIGAFISIKRNDFLKISKIKLLLLYIIIIISIFIWAILNNFGKRDGLRSAWCYHNPLVLLLGALYLIIFMKLNFQSCIVNYLSKCSFLCFLTHPYILKLIDFKQIREANLLEISFLIIISVLLSYMFSIFVYFIYSISFKKLFYKMKKINLYYFYSEERE